MWSGLTQGRTDGVVTAVAIRQGALPPVASKITVEEDPSVHHRVTAC